MKLLLFVFIFPLSTWASFKKPHLLARYASPQNYNLPENVYCFYSEPAVTHKSVFLGCIDENGPMMMKWKNSVPEVVARPETGNLFSTPLAFAGGVSWYEFDLEGSRNHFVDNGNRVVSQKIGHLGNITSFLPLGNNEWVYHLKNERQELWTFNQGNISPMFIQDVSYIFSPIVGADGELAIKIRRSSLDESEADELWSYRDGQWKKMFEDKDADPASPWKSFRHQLALSGDKILTFATDQNGEALVLIDEKEVKEIARVGEEISSFDYFSPKMRAGTILFRGVDREGRKVIWAHDGKEVIRLLTQGDVVQTDKGPGIVHYENEHSIFYGSPGIGPSGEVVVQATLSDFDFPTTLLGIGILKFEKE